MNEKNAECQVETDYIKRMEKREDEEWELRIEKALKKFGTQVRTQVAAREAKGLPAMPVIDMSPERQEVVMAALKAEIKRQRPNALPLLYGKE